MTVVGYELPKAERLVGGWIAPQVVKEGQYGTDRIAPYEKFNDFDTSTGRIEALEAHDYIVFARHGGYVVDQHSKDTVVGMQIDCWAKTRSRAEEMANKVTMLMYEMEGQTIDGFSIDFVEALRGPEEDKSNLVNDERVMTVGFEIHIGAKWIYKDV